MVVNEYLEPARPTGNSSSQWRTLATRRVKVGAMMRSRFAVLGLLAAFACRGATEVSKPTPNPIPTGQQEGLRNPGTGDDAPLPLWSEVKRGTLANGLTYYILKH